MAVKQSPRRSVYIPQHISLAPPDIELIPSPYRHSVRTCGVQRGRILEGLYAREETGAHTGMQLRHSSHYAIMESISQIHTLRGEESLLQSQLPCRMRGMTLAAAYPMSAPL